MAPDVQPGDEVLRARVGRIGHRSDAELGHLTDDVIEVAARDADAVELEVG